MASPIISSDNYSYKGGTSGSSGKSPDFLQYPGGKTVLCHGRITEVEHQELFYSKFHKVVNCLFRGEPLQFGHQTLEYLIRVEELSPAYSTRSADFFLYGNFMGRMMPGDEIEITAKDCRGRRIVKSLTNVSTGSRIRPGLQLPAGLVRGLAAGLLLLPFLVAAGVQSGAFQNALTYLALIGGGFLCARGYFRSKFGK